MAVAHFFPSCGLALGQKTVNFTSDTLQVLLIASGTYTWNATALGHVHVSDFLAGSGAGALTEVSLVGTNYTRQTLATVGLSDSVSAPSGYTTLTVSGNPTWSSATFSTSYALFFDNTVGGTDSTNQIICYWDLGGSRIVTSATPFVLNLGSLNGVSQGLIQWQSS
jgi:hypothetical protein